MMLCGWAAFCCMVGASACCRCRLCVRPPLSYWISCFFFPQGFMTASLQEPTACHRNGRFMDLLYDAKRITLLFHNSVVRIWKQGEYAC